LIIHFIEEMKKLIFTFLLFSITYLVSGQKPKNGTYTYQIAFAEWNGKSLGATCSVIIKGDSVKVIHNGTKSLTGNKGDIIDQGILLKHKLTGKWIIAHDRKDVDAIEVGGCSDGPSVIDIKRRRFWTC